VEEILQRAKQNKVDAIINICTDVASLEKGLILAKRHPFVCNAAATTPHDVDKEGALFFPIVASHARNKQLVAIGETGLDYYYEHSDKETQKTFLLRYFDLASQVSLPLIFHCRDAFADLFALADAHYSQKPAVLHCFTGTVAEAKSCLDRGWLVSFSGIITFKKSDALREVAKFVPLDRMLIETDAPYLAPQSKRGKLNEPGYLPETASCIAAIKGIDVEEVARATRENAIDFFRLSGL
jgi:TatD DNase family protein